MNKIILTVTWRRYSHVIARKAAMKSLEIKIGSRNSLQESSHNHQVQTATQRFHGAKSTGAATAICERRVRYSTCSQRPKASRHCLVSKRLAKMNETRKFSGQGIEEEVKNVSMTFIIYRYLKKKYKSCEPSII